MNSGKVVSKNKYKVKRPKGKKLQRIRCEISVRIKEGRR
jgi:hypothetical protein